MPSSVIIGALVLAWLVVLVPMIARKRQEVARTADSALAARVVPRTAAARQGNAGPRARLEDHAMPEDDRPEPDELEDVEEFDDEVAESHADSPAEDRAVDDADPVEEAEPAEQLTTELPLPEEEQYVTRPYRPGRGGYNAEAAELAAAAKYALRRRVVLFLFAGTVITAVLAPTMYKPLYWAAGGLLLALVGYLTYLRRQVRIEAEIRRRRTARIRAARTVAVEEQLADDGYVADSEYDEYDYEGEGPALPPLPPRTQRATVRPGTAVVDYDDGDPAFDDLDEPDVLPYRRAAGQ